MTVFHPPPRLVLRVTIYAALVVFGLISSAFLFSKLVWVVAMALLFGSFRIARINGDQFERRLVLMFIPLPWKRWPMQRFIEIETRYGDASALSTMLPLAFLNVILTVWMGVFDLLIPWLGGTYQLRLRLAKGGRVLVWQGNSDGNFEANLALLQSATGLPLRRV